MNLEHTNKTYYQISIQCALALEKREIYNTAKDIEDRLREIKKEVGKENIKEFIEKNVKIYQINELKVINLGKGIPNERNN